MSHDDLDSTGKACLRITKATAQDCAAIASILVKSWQAAYRGIMPDELLDGLSVQQREEGWRRHLNSGGNAYIGWITDKPIGVIETCDFRDAIEGFSQWGEIPIIYLLPEKYGIGLGSELMRFALSALTERGREQVGIWVLQKNIRAIAFYQKHGFLRSAHTKIHKPTGLVELLFLKSKEAIHDRH